MAVGLAAGMLPVPPLSQRCGDPTSQLPHFELCSPATACKPNTLWELSSFSEAAMAVALLVEVLPDPPLSQASQLPLFELCSPAPACKPNPLWELSSFSEAAKAVGLLAGMLPVPPLSQASQLPHLIAFQGMLCGVHSASSLRCAH